MTGVRLKQMGSLHIKMSARRKGKVMKVHYLQHVPFEDSGSIEGWVRNGGYSLSATHLYRGDSLPDIDAVELLVSRHGRPDEHL